VDLVEAYVLGKNIILPLNPIGVWLGVQNTSAPDNVKNHCHCAFVEYIMTDCFGGSVKMQALK
jgi:hypothetical protein